MSEICSTCGLPKELCVCETIAKETQRIKVYIEKRKFGKKYTIVKGIDEREIDLRGLGKKLKTFLACGGTVKDGFVELQGNHAERVKKFLVGLGFAEERIDMGR